MKNEYCALAGLACGAIGLSLGLTMSSALPNSPSTYGIASAVYAAVVAAVVGGVRNRRDDLSRE